MRVGGRRCAVGRATPLSVLAGTRLALRLRDYGSCGRSPADAGSLYVRAVGPATAPRAARLGLQGRPPGRDDRRGRPVRAVRHRAAARRRGCCGSGACRTAADGCQRTLEAGPSAGRRGAGAPLRVTVRGYDDNGRGVPVAGATVRLGAAQALTDADGVAQVTAPGGRALRGSTAEHAGMVRSFPRRCVVG